jgi:hypothetical protein
MPTHQPKENRIIPDCLTALRDAGLSARIEPDPSSAMGEVLVIERDGDDLQYGIEVRDLSGTAGEYLPAGVSPSTGRKRRLLCSRYIAPQAALKLKEAGVNYVDAAGNAYLTGPGLHVYVAGKKKSGAHAPQTTSRLFQSAGLRLVYLLLKNPRMVSRTYRELSSLAGISLGSVSVLFKELRRQGYLARIRKNEFRLVEERRLFERWSIGYSERLRGKLHIGNYRYAGEDDLAGLAARASMPELRAALPGVLIGGELGGALVYPGMLLKPLSSTLHIPAGDDEDRHELITRVIKNLKIVPDEDGNLVLMHKMTAADAGREVPVNGRRAALADPILIHAEILHAAGLDERLQALADGIYEQEILPRWS